ncbi:MAG: ATP-binding cassette domain-containing protein [Gammaproteobacteria bacterium]|nr:ATP-binding cassette domain-containing protein [Gammaproteobacteria bacterium]
MQYTSEDFIVSASDIHFAYRNRPIFEGLNLTIPRGKVTVIMGPSGCGKSTFLGLLGGRLAPTSGSLEFDGQPVLAKPSASLYKMRRKMGMLFQQNALLTDLNVFDNVAFPLRETTELQEPLIRIQVLTKLEMVGLRGAGDMQISELSGGMARRVALARAIVLDPLIVMYDEPFVGLDPISMGIILKLIRNLNDALNLTSIVVTHDVKEGCEIADYMYLLDRGRVSAHGTPDQMLMHEDPAIEQFMKGLSDGPVRFHYPARDYLEDLQDI